MNYCQSNIFEVVDIFALFFIATIFGQDPTNSLAEQIKKPVKEEQFPTQRGKLPYLWAKDTKCGIGGVLSMVAIPTGGREMGQSPKKWWGAYEWGALREK